METRLYAQILGRRIWIIILAVLITVGVAAFVTSRMTPVYSAAALVRIAPLQNTSADYYLVTYSDRLMNTYIRLLKSRPMLQEVASRLKIDLTPEQLASMITVESVPSTELIELRVESQDPQQATAIANALAYLFVEQRASVYSGTGTGAAQLLQQQLQSTEQELSTNRALLATIPTVEPQMGAMATRDELTARIAALEATYSNLLEQYDQAKLSEALRSNSVTIAEPAVTPVSPSSPRPVINLGVGLLVGLVGGLGLAFLFDRLDPTIHTPADLAALAPADILVQIPRMRVPRKGRDRTIVFDRNETTPATEAFRTLSADVLHAADEGNLRTFLVSSAEPRAGKSTVLINLGIALARGGARVILVDSDLHRPALHHALGLSNATGLTTLVLGNKSVEDALQQTRIPGLLLLSSGKLPPDALEIFALPKMDEVIRQLAERASVVLFDSPPILASADAVHLARKLDAVLLVLNEEQSSTADLARAMAQLERVGARPYGLVYNRARGNAGEYRYYSPAERPTKELRDTVARPAQR